MFRTPFSSHLQLHRLHTRTPLIHLQYLIPFLWPKGKFHLQLLYIGVGLCLVMDRVLNVLVPLQLGVITDVLSKGDGKNCPLKNLQQLPSLSLLPVS